MVERAVNTCLRRQVGEAVSPILTGRTRVRTVIVLSLFIVLVLFQFFDNQMMRNEVFLVHLPRVVIFDFNGTLLDDLGVAYGSVQEIFNTYDMSCPTIQQFREEITADFMEFYYRHGFPKTTTADELNAIRRKFYRANGDKAQIRADVRATLNWLLAVGLYASIVSAEVTTTLHKYLLRDGLNRKFDFIRPEAWGSTDAKPKALAQAIDVFSCSPEDMIYVDDTVDGLVAAKQVGITPVAFTNPTGYNSSHRLMEVAGVNINEIGDLKNLIKD